MAKQATRRGSFPWRRRNSVRIPSAFRSSIFQTSLTPSPSRRRADRQSASHASTDSGALQRWLETSSFDPVRARTGRSLRTRPGSSSSASAQSAPASRASAKSGNRAPASPSGQAPPSRSRRTVKRSGFPGNAARARETSSPGFAPRKRSKRSSSRSQSPSPGGTAASAPKFSGTSSPTIFGVRKFATFFTRGEGRVLPLGPK